MTGRAEISIIDDSAAKDCANVDIGTLIMNMPLKSAKFTAIFDIAPVAPSPTSPHMDRNACLKEKIRFSSVQDFPRDFADVISQRMYLFRSRPAIGRETKFSASLIAIRKMSARLVNITRMVWCIWALGLGFVAYAASQSFSYTAWFAPVWIFLPLLFINFEQLLACLRRSKKVASESRKYNRNTSIEVYVKDVGELNTSTDETCVICLFSFESGDSTRRLACRHLFHKACIDHYFTRQVSTLAERVSSDTDEAVHTPCPICRQDILKADSV